MTIREKLVAQLVDHGLWPQEALDVIKIYEDSDAGVSMKGRWDEDISEYPVALLSTLFLILKGEAVKWIDANKPMHFARGILEA
jgi:hypothetical protein